LRTASVGEAASVTEYPCADEAASASVVNPVDVGHDEASERGEKDTMPIDSHRPTLSEFDSAPNSIATSPASGSASIDVSVLPFAIFDGGSLSVAPDGVSHSTDDAVTVTISIAESVISGIPYEATAALRISDTRTSAASRN